MRTTKSFVGALALVLIIGAPVLADLPIGAGVDATKTDGGLAFASCADGSLAVATETSPGKFEIVQTVKTLSGARTMGVVDDPHNLFTNI